MKGPALQFLAGPKARQILARDGFHHKHFKVMFGASGGPKWLMLNRIDRVLFGGDFFKGRKDPLYMFGSSIGGWRFTLAAQKNPIKAIQGFEDIYVDYHWPADTDAALITKISRKMFGDSVGDAGAKAALSHPFMRLAFAAERVRAGLAFKNTKALAGAMFLTFLMNVVSRKTLGWFYERIIFSDTRSDFQPDKVDAFPTRFAPLNEKNYLDALMASSSIPVVMEPVIDVPDGPEGLYVDGGLIDYHWDFPVLSCEEETNESLVLYPHFKSRLVPGWFDKGLQWRKPGVETLDRMLMIAPTDEFIASLPGGVIPTRKDFKAFSNEERISRWRHVLKETDRLADELASVMETGDIGPYLRAF